MTLHELKALLLTVGPPVYHYHAHQQPSSYIVWAEYGSKNLSADSEYEDKVYRVQVDYFTKAEFDPRADTITSLLNKDEVSFNYLVDYEDDTGYIHHIFDLEVV